MALHAAFGGRSLLNRADPGVARQSCSRWRISRANVVSASASAALIRLPRCASTALMKAIRGPWFNERAAASNLARRLFDVVRVNSLGRVVLNSGGSGQARDFVAGEHDLLRSLFPRRDKANGYDTDGADGGNGVAPSPE